MSTSASVQLASPMNQGEPVWARVIEKQKLYIASNPRDPRLPVEEALLDDMKERREFGIQKYGQELMSKDGRNGLIDAYQEALDLRVYLEKEYMVASTVRRRYIVRAIEASRAVLRELKYGLMVYENEDAQTSNI